MRKQLPPLIITNQYDVHADYVIDKFKKKGISFLRFNTDTNSAISNLSFQTNKYSNEVVFTIDGNSYLPKDIGNIWYRKPTGIIVESLITNISHRELVNSEALTFFRGWWQMLAGHYWISDIDKIRAAGFKLYQLNVAQKLGFIIPPTLITNDANQFLQFWKICHGQVVYKLLGKMVGFYDNDDSYSLTMTTKLKSDFMQHLDSIQLTPCLFQRYILKKVELRITIVENKVFTAALYTQDSDGAEIDWRRIDTDKIKHEIYKLPQELELLCIKLVKRLGLKFGAIDMILTPKGDYVFLEINPNGQWLWIEHMTGLKISGALVKALSSPKMTIRKK